MLTFYRFWVWVVLYCRVYYIWSRLHRWLFDQKYKGTRLPMYDKLEHLETVVGQMVWRKDGWRSLWDAICSPEAVWARHSSGQPIGDCDQASIFYLSRLVNMANRGELIYLGVPPCVPGTTKNLGLLSVPWFDKGNRKTGGHNVAVMKYYDHDADKHRWAYMSNWYDGKIVWGFDSLKAIVKTVCNGKASLGWAVTGLDLKRWQYGRGSKV